LRRGWRTIVSTDSLELVLDLEAYDATIVGDTLGDAGDMRVDLYTIRLQRGWLEGEGVVFAGNRIIADDDRLAITKFPNCFISRDLNFRGIVCHL
jgi:hypothetical protein